MNAFVREVRESSYTEMVPCKIRMKRPGRNIPSRGNSKFKGPGAGRRG